MTKFCTRCGLTKNSEDFYSNSRTKDGKQAWCKNCIRARRHERDAVLRASRPSRVLMSEPTLRRFYAKVVVDLDSGCWLWDAAKSGKGNYGFFYDGYTTRRAHVVAYEHFIGEVPEGLVLGHICPNKCAFPEHVRPITQSQNVQEGTGWQR